MTETKDSGRQMFAQSLVLLLSSHLGVKKKIEEHAGAKL